jgi:hypothetical protein
MKDADAKAAKRIVAEGAIRAALAAIEETKPTGGPYVYNSQKYRLALHLSRHAAEQLRLAEQSS